MVGCGGLEERPGGVIGEIAERKSRAQRSSRRPLLALVYAQPVPEQVAEAEVLVIGLDPYRVPGPWDPEPVAVAIEAGMRKFAEHGVAAQSCLFGLDGQDDPEAMVSTALQSQPWKCVVVGGGVRTAEGQLQLFESIINLIRCHAPHASIAFNATASDTYEAAARWLGPAASI